MGFTKYEDPSLPDVTLFFDDWSSGKAQDHKFITAEARYAIRVPNAKLTLYIYGVIPRGPPNVKLDSEYETGEAHLTYRPGGDTNKIVFPGIIARLNADIRRLSIDSESAEIPPPYTPTSNIFANLRFSHLKGVVGFLRHDLNEVVMRDHWSEEVFRNDVCVTAVYSRQSPHYSPEAARRKYRGTLKDWINPAVYLEDIQEKVTLSEEPREIQMPWF